MHKARKIQLVITIVTPTTILVMLLLRAPAEALIILLLLHMLVFFGIRYKYYKCSNCGHKLSLWDAKYPEVCPGCKVP